MKMENPKSTFFLSRLIFLIISGLGFSFFSFIVPEQQDRYLDVVCQDDKFIALTEKGRINWISNSGKIVHTEKIEGGDFNHLAVEKQFVVVAGKNGALFLSSDASGFQKMESSITTDIKSVSFFRDMIILGANGGDVQIINANGLTKDVQLNLKGNVVSLATGNAECYGVTDKGEIIRTSDGINWTVFDFNEVYKGYYKSSSFTKVVVTSTQIAVLGESLEGTPVLFLSSKGNVWTERPLIYTTEEGAILHLSEIPVDIFYDALNDQFIMPCSNGWLLTVPSCSQCHKLYKITDKSLLGISGNEDALILVGDEGFYELINFKDIGSL